MVARFFRYIKAMFGFKKRTVISGGVTTIASVGVAAFLVLAGQEGKPKTEKYEGIILGEYYDTSHVLTWCGGETQVGRLPEGEAYTYEYCKPLFDAQWDRYSAKMASCYPEDLYPYISVNMHVAFTDTFYNTGARCSSGMMRALKRKDLTGACEFLKEYRHSRTARGGRLDMLDGRKNGKMDCSLTEGEAQGCYGVWKRRLEFYEDCIKEAKQIPPEGIGG